METLRIGSRAVGPGQPCFVIAEAGVNHNGSLDLALRLVDEAVTAGADAVKFQTFRADAVAGAAARKASYQTVTTDAGESQLDMLRKLELRDEDFAVLADYCAKRGILFLSTPFEEGSADLLERLGMAAYKLPSGELTNHPFLAHVARKGRPIIQSTGMANLDEVANAVAVIAGAGNPPLALLHCVSAYPADPADCNLRAMATLERRFGLPVGFSDHTAGIEIAQAAVALGAVVIEKHFTLDCGMPGPDHRASLEPQQLAAMIRGIRMVESALGDGTKAPRAAEADVRGMARKSVAAARDLSAGTVLDTEALAIMRPGDGIAPADRGKVVGRRLTRDVGAGEVLTWDLLA